MTKNSVKVLRILMGLKFVFKQKKSNLLSK